MFNENEKQLYITLMEWIAVEMAVFLGNTEYGRQQNIENPLDFSKIKGSIIHHGYSSDWTEPCDLLWELGIISPRSNKASYPKIKRKGYPPEFICNLNAEDISLHLLTGDWESFPAIDDVIAHFCELHLFQRNGKTSFSTRVIPFEVGLCFLPVFSQLETCSYVKRTGNLFSWTNKVGEAFKRLCFWEYPSRRAELEFEEKIAKDALTAYHTMPNDWKEDFLTAPRMDGRFDLRTQEALKRWWDGNKWCDVSIWSNDEFNKGLGMHYLNRMADYLNKFAED